MNISALFLSTATCILLLKMDSASGTPDCARKWELCGGQILSYMTGDLSFMNKNQKSRCCEAGSQCFKSSKWYSQCRPSCPAGWECPTPTSIEFVQASSKRGSDRGSGAKRDLSLYRPAPSSYASFGDTDSTRAVPAVHVSKVDKAIANGEVSWSIGWQRVWNDENSGNKLDFDVYVPKCPDNFVAIGMVAVFGSKLGHHSLPSKRVLCVNWYHSQLVEGGVTSPNVWSDAGTGSKWDLVVGRLAHGLLWPTHSDMARPPASYNFKKQ